MNAKQAKETADKWLEEYLRTRLSELKVQELQKKAEAQRRARPLDETGLVRFLAFC